MASAIVGPGGGLVGPGGGLVGPGAGTSAAAGLAAGTGTTYDTAMRYAPAELASGIGIASDPSADTGSGAVDAEVAAGTGTASNATTEIAPVIAAATGTGAAGAAAASVVVSGGLASGTGVAYNPRLPAQQLVVFDLGGTWASQTVVFDIDAPFTLSVQPVLFDILGSATASQAVVFDLGETGSIAFQPVLFDILDETDGAAILSVQDLYGQLATALIRDTAAVKTRTGTNAAALASLVMGHANTWLGREGEVQWEVDASGSLTFFGDDTLSGDILGILGKIATQSLGENAEDVTRERDIAKEGQR